MLEIQGYKDFYEQERLKVYNMDCMELLKQVPDKYFDLAIIDPPYGIGEDGSNNKSRSKLTTSKNYRPFAGNDKKPADIQFFKELFRTSTNQIIFGANHFIENINKNSSCWIVWDKNNGLNDFADCELAWTSFKTSVRKFFFTWNGMLQENMKDKEFRIHPTQKPVALYSWLLEKYAKPNFKIIDTHFGSGSHAIANHYYGSELIACELDEDYFKASIERIKKETRQLSFLQGGG